MHLRQQGADRPWPRSSGEQRDRGRREAAGPNSSINEVGVAPGTSLGQTTAHNQQAAELDRHEHGGITTRGANGYYRRPALRPWARFGARPRLASTKLDRSRPEVLGAPKHPPVCRTQPTIIVPRASPFREPTYPVLTRHKAPGAGHLDTYLA